MSLSLGDQLKQARESRNLTLDQVAQMTYIRVRYLEALETNQRSALPSAVQGRGFLRLYASFLNLPLQPLLDAWDGKITDEPSVEKPPIEPLETDLVQSPNEDGRQIDEEPIQDTPQKAPAEVQAQSGLEVPLIEPAAPEPAPTSQEILATIGNQLKQRREKLGISLPDCEKYTSIRQRNLIALEAGRLDDLPSPVQGRGMLNIYARFLELDTDGLLLGFAEALQTRRIELMPPIDPKKKLPTFQKVNGKFLRRFMTVDLLIGGSIILLLFIFVVWSASSVLSNPTLSNPATPPSISTVLHITSSPGVLTTATPVESPISPDAQNLKSTPTAGDQAVITGTVPASGLGPLQVYVVASQSAWMKVTVDKKVVFLGRVVPGNAYPFSGSQRIELTSGNAAALQIFFNQNDLGSLGIVGQVVNLVFTLKDGVQTPTAAFTPTRTATPVQTLTRQPTPTQTTPTLTPFVP